MRCSLSHFPVSQDGADAGQQLPQAKWLGDVIVSSQLQAHNAVDFVAAMTGGDDDGDVGMRSDFAQETEAILLSKPQIKDDQVRLVAGQERGDLVSSRGRDRSDVMIFEVAR